MKTLDVLMLMLPAFCECLVLVGIHSYLGVHVVKRKVIFVDLALAQIAAIGTLVAFLFGIAPHTAGAYVFSAMLTAAAAAVFALCRFRQGKIPQEAIIGLVYAIAAATAILLIDKAPHGAEHLKEILTGSILWVKWPSIALAAGVYAAVGAFHYVFRAKFMLISDNPEEAYARGVNVRLWDFLFYLTFGVVITLSVDTAGVLIVFVFLVAPAIVAIAVSDSLRTQLFIGWGMGVAVTSAGLWLSYAADLPTGPSVIGAYGATILAMAGCLYVARSGSVGRALVRVALAIAGFASFFALMALIGFAWPKEEHHAHSHGGSPPGIGESSLPPSPGASAGSKETDPFGGVEDPGERVDLVTAAIAKDRKKGAGLGLLFLSGDPPVFFRQEVADVLEAAAGRHLDFHPEEAWSSEANRKAAEEARKAFELE